MLAAVQAFHDKHRFKQTGAEDLVYRVALMAEELACILHQGGEIQCYRHD